VAEPIIWWDEKKEVYTSERLYPQIKEMHTNPHAQRGLSTGYLLLDEFFTWRKGFVTVISGVPNHGKSEFLDQLMVNTVFDHGWKWGIFSPENYPYEGHFEKIAEKMSGMTFCNLTARQVDEIVAKANKYFYWVYPKSPTLASIAACWEHLVIDQGVDAVMLDPWNCIEHKRPAKQPETEYIGEALTGWTDFARQMKVAVVIVAHPTKIPTNRETGMPYLMSGYDINGSANWVNKPDNVIIVQRPDFNTTFTHVHVQKVRDQRHTGKRGAVKFDYFQGRGGTYQQMEVLR
jgi:twinkle protein